MDFKTTADIKVSDKIIGQILGQDEAVNIIKKAAKQRRNVLLIGTAGTGKSLCGQALAQLLPKSKLVDILCLPNHADEDTPLIQTVPAKKGFQIVQQAKLTSMSGFKGQQTIFFILAMIALMIPWYLRKEIGDIMAAASLLAGMMFVGALAISFGLNMRMGGKRNIEPKLLVDNSKQKNAPFMDGTGAHAGALLGDCLHDPLQCLSPNSKVDVIREGYKSEYDIGEFVESLFREFPSRIEKYENYEYLYLPEDIKIYTFGNKAENLKLTRIRAVNRQAYSGDLIKISTKDKKLCVTPEHPIAQDREYIAAENLRVNSSLYDAPIIDKFDIVNLFRKSDREKIIAYSEFLELHKQYPNYGFKKLARLLKVSHPLARGWLKGHKPMLLKQIEALEKAKLIPLCKSDDRLPIIARIAGVLFGDGGVSRNLFDIFFSTGVNDQCDAEAFKSDVLSVFGQQVGSHIHQDISGGYGDSLRTMVTKKYVALFFAASGVPIGNKTKTEFKVPPWIYENEATEKEFFNALLASELAVPCEVRNHLGNMSFNMSKDEKLEASHIAFLNELRAYLIRLGIEIGEVKRIKKAPSKSQGYGFLVYSSLNNVIHFNTVVSNLPYADYKKRAIESSINKLKNIDTWRMHKKSTISEAVELFKLGLQKKDIAEKLDIPRGTVNDWLPKVKERHCFKYSSDIIETARGLHKAGNSYSKICEKLDVPKSSVARWINGSN